MLSEYLPCREVWPEMAAHAGRDPSVAPVLLRDDGAVVRYGDVVLKHAPDGFAKVVRAHRQASRMMRDNKLDCAARFMGFNEEHQVLMVSYARGGRLATLAHEGEDPIRLSMLVGRWLRSFHDARDRDEAPFDAVRPLNMVPEAATYLPFAFRQVRKRLSAMADGLQGTMQARAVLHGDLNASNLIVRGDTVTGIDFENINLHPALRDAGQILAALHLRAAHTPNEILPQTWRAAFESEYGPTGPLLDFFVLQRLLLHWSRVPAGISHLGEARFHMATALDRMFCA